jgi:signal transduction histidine kinase
MPTQLAQKNSMTEASSPRLLVVEDDQDTQSNLHDILELDGYEVDAVSSIKQARQKDWNEYFAFVLDHRLPDGTAEELLPEIREVEPSAGILIVTGHADLNGTITALRHGVDDYILKPIDADALRASLIRIRKIREARDCLIQSERLAAIGEMVSGIAHESRNFLQKIFAAVESLQSKVGWEEDDAADLAGIRRGCDGLTRLLNDLREYAAPITLDRCCSDLAKVWRMAWKNLMSQHSEQNGTLIEQMDSEQAWAYIDHFRMEQVFRNLFENSLAACSGSARITVRSENRAADGTLRVTVSDDGPGLKMAHPSTVFQPFFTTKSRGTGLGLSIVRRIVEAHGGTITARNGAPQGAIFELQFPNAVPSNGESSLEN